MTRFHREEAQHIINIHKETSKKYIDGINVSDYKEIAELARDEKDHYEFIFNKMIEVFILWDSPDMKGKEEEIFETIFKEVIYPDVYGYTNKIFQIEGHEKEHWENLNNNKESKFNLELLIKHYSSYIAYYKFHVQWILKNCLFKGHYGQYLGLIEKQRKIFEPKYIKRGIDEMSRPQEDTKYY